VADKIVPRGTGVSLSGTPLLAESSLSGAKLSGPSLSGILMLARTSLHGVSLGGILGLAGALLRGVSLGCTLSFPTPRCRRGAMLSDTLLLADILPHAPLEEGVRLMFLKMRRSQLPLIWTHAVRTCTLDRRVQRLLEGSS
jgi:uncharacterized protein YjbI with pentapeptide repeats